MIAAIVGLATTLAVGSAVGAANGSELGAVDVAGGAIAMAVPVLILHLVSPASMGFGDVKAAIVLGAAVGTVDGRLGAVALCLAAALGATVGLVTRRRTIPFGPFLVAGAWVVLLAHDPIAEDTVHRGRAIMTAARPAGGTVAASPSAERGFQPASRRRNRIAAGVALAAIAIGGNLWVYSNLDTSEPVVQAVRDIPAGEQITTDMLRTVDVDVDSTVNVIAGDRLDSLVGSYAKVRLVSGSLVTAEALQPTPLVTPGASVVAIQVADGALPIGLRERVPVLLVVPDDRTAADSATTSVSGRVVGLPTDTSSALGLQSLSVEVAAADAATIAAADDVRVVLVEPSDDPAVTPGAAEDGGP